MRTQIAFIFSVCPSVLLLMIAACSSDEKKPEQVSPSELTRVLLPDAPKNITDSIQAEFEGAMPVHLAADSILKHIQTAYHISPNQVIVGASTCVDDIIYTKNFHSHREVQGPFHLGGLAGLPFTGISGLTAFAHHIPENGTMLLFIAPHIGYTNDKGWGYVNRMGQHKPSTCCGALMGTLKKLEKGLLMETVPTEEDYQGISINNMAVLHEKEITADLNPLVALTKVTCQEAEKQILEQVERVEMENIRYIITMTGILINTDYQYTDYLWLDHFSVYDVKTKTFLENASK